ncbi:hypothetical protein J8281_15025 [Aquimarina sp. U1-2]|uniref:hypothetical protein n=1 Tax=Aquimarina sp. U1-2 TaxID=2823141 RepID=UPI001AED0943|nr:hypothetical protein [Aquimarina sp. U1-2]MBP2833506.1 hypothetical protein [Aquimarina sp. U1-2]
MSEIGDIIKKIASQVDTVTTFAAIVTDNEIKEVDGKKEYAVTVRKLANVGQEYDNLQTELDSSYKSDSVNTKDNDKSNIDPTRKSNFKIEYKNVRLKSTINDINQGLIIIPKLGSWVLVSVIDNISSKLFISQFSEIDSILVKIDKSLKPNASNDNEEPEYFEVDFNANTFDMKFGDLFETHINKEQFNIKFLQPKENDENSPQKILSEVNYVKDNLYITFLDDDEKPRATVHADQENLNVSFLENEEETLATKLNKEKVTIEVADGCTAVIEKDKASITTNGGTEEISIDKNTGVTLKSGSNINIDASGSVTISGSSVNIN